MPGVRVGHELELLEDGVMQVLLYAMLMWRVIWYMHDIRNVVELPAYECSTSDEDEDYLQPPNSRAQTPPPCYSDIFDSDDSVSE